VVANEVEATVFDLEPGMAQALFDLLLQDKKRTATEPWIRRDTGTEPRIDVLAGAG
jgi:hypothetical protein